MKVRNNKKLIFIGLGIFTFLLFIAIIAVVSSRNSEETTRRYAQQSAASSDNNTIPFAGLSANTAADVTREFNQKLAEQKRQEAKEIAAIKAQQQNSQKSDSQMSASQNESAKQRIDEAVNAAVSKVKAASEEHYQSLEKQIQQQYQVGKGKQSVSTSQPSEVETKWIKDETNTYPPLKQGETEKTPLGIEHYNLFGTQKTTSPDGTSSANLPSLNKTKKPTVIPAYTLPNPTILTNVMVLNPLVGRIPKGDQHKVTSPFEAAFVVEHPNMTSNNHSMAQEVSKVMGTVICVGDFMAEANSCYVNVITLVFDDGRIATFKSKANQSSGGSDANFKGLGFLADAYGNPQIKGDLKSSLGLRLGITGLTAGTSAIGAALAQSGLSTTGGNQLGPAWTQVTNVTDYAAGQGINAAAQGMQKEWSQVEKNMFDYVYTPNWSEKQRALKRFNIIITKQVEFNYDMNGRKIDYDFTLNEQTDNFIF